MEIETRPESSFSAAVKRIELFFEEYPNDLCQWPDKEHTYVIHGLFGLSHVNRVERTKGGIYNQYKEELNMSRDVYTRSVLGVKLPPRTTYTISILAMTNMDGTYRQWKFDTSNGIVLYSGTKPSWELKFELFKEFLSPGSHRYDEELRDLEHELDGFAIPVPS